MKGLEDEHRDSDLKVLFVGFQDSPRKIKAYSERFGICPVGYDRKNLLAGRFGINYGAGVILIDSEGKVRKCIDRGFKRDDLREALKVIL